MHKKVVEKLLLVFCVLVISLELLLNKYLEPFALSLSKGGSDGSTSSPRTGCFQGDMRY